MRRPLFPILLLLICGPLAAEAAAQASAAPSLEMSFGISSGAGGTFLHRGGVSADALLGIPLRQGPRSRLVGALAAGVQGAPMRTLECVQGPDGECIPSFPTLGSVAGLVGVERGSGKSATARLLAGPAFYWGEGGGQSLGVQGRVDVATAGRLGVVASLRHGILPDYQGEVLRLTSFGVGLRLRELPF